MLVIMATCAAMATQSQQCSLSLDKIEDAQQRWCEGLLAMSGMRHSDHSANAKLRLFAQRYIDAEYADHILFKPTLSSTTRTDRQGALAYFVGGDDSYEKDMGFAKKERWVACRYPKPSERNTILSNDRTLAVLSGPLTLTYCSSSDDGEDSCREKKTITVDKTFTYRCNPLDPSKAQLVQHHSSKQHTSE